MTLDNDPPAKGALPADRHGLWDIVGAHNWMVFGVVAAAHRVRLLGFKV